MSTVGEKNFVNTALANNYQTVTKTRTISCLAAGVVAGVLGLTNLMGVLFFVACAVVTSFLLKLQLKGEGNKYFPHGSAELFSFGSLISGVLTFILAWTVAYDSIYIF